MLEFGIFFISGFVHGVLGFGFPLVATPLLSIFLSVKEAVLLTLFPTLFSNAKTVKNGTNFLNIFKEYKWLILPIVAGSFLGTTLLISYDVTFYKLLLAFVILLYLNKSFFNLSLHVAIKPTKMMLVFGLLSGLVSGLVNIMVPVLIIYILEAKIEKEKSITLMNLCFLSSKATQILLFGLNGSFNKEFLVYMILVIFITYIGLIFGEKIRNHIDEKVYTKILKTILWILSFYLIYQSLF